MSNSTTIALIKKIGGGGGSGGNVPAPEVADIGKVLGIVEDGAGAKYAPVEGSGSGLPDPSTLTDGTVMVAVNGEWKMQEGYGYTGDPAFEPITWDGETEGRESLMGVYYKVSDVVIDPSNIEGCSVIFHSTASGNVPDTLHFGGSEGVVSIGSLANLGLGIYFASSDFDLEGVSVTKGVYFPLDDYGYVSSLTCPPSVHKFDPALIPSSGVEEFAVIFEQEVETLVATADKTAEEIGNALMSGKKIKGYLYQVSEYGKSFISELNMSISCDFYSVPLFNTNDNLFDVFRLSYNGENWDVDMYYYTLTPAT